MHTILFTCYLMIGIVRNEATSWAVVVMINVLLSTGALKTQLEYLLAFYAVRLNRLFCVVSIMPLSALSKWTGVGGIGKELFSFSGAVEMWKKTVDKQVAIWQRDSSRRDYEWNAAIRLPKKYEILLACNNNCQSKLCLHSVVANQRQYRSH